MVDVRPPGYDAEPGSDAFGTADAQLEATGDERAVTVAVHQGGGLVVGARFEAGEDAVPTPGTLASVPVQDARQPGVRRRGGWRPTVQEVEFAGGHLTRFAATWRHSCSLADAGAELRGSRGRRPPPLSPSPGSSGPTRSPCSTCCPSHGSRASA